ncbi:MAG: hypothetical protein ACR2H1_10790 [Limisphaerales bacterium]
MTSIIQSYRCVFKPANDGLANDPFPTPAPAPSSATTLSIFKGTNPNGLWRLYVVDDTANGDTGSIAGGWSMTIRTTALFTSSTFITINDSVTPPTKASPYPSSILVSNLIGNVVKVTATLKGFTHNYPGDVDILLDGPLDPSFIIPSLILMSDAGGAPSVTNLTFTFDDSAAVRMPEEDPLTNGTFLPSNFGLGSDTFPLPAPIPSSATNLSIFNGKNPNGRWDLCVVDDTASDAGQIANGWSLNITTEIPAPVIINPRLVGGFFQFNWLSVNGAFYKVERKFDLGSPTWTTVLSFIGNGGLVGYFINTTGNSSPEFFRVEASQP